MNREKELKKEGWNKRSILSDPRLTEVVDLYEQIGLEVLLEPFKPEDMDDCSECFKRVCDHYKVIYTRPAEDKKDLDDGLYK